ncbi:MAG: hypothetical protein ACXABY_17925 [Candidatus Thorarchaeota archaeon]
MLYVFRCAIYYASNNEHDPQLLKWQNWKDTRTKRQTSKRTQANCKRMAQKDISSHWNQTL